MKTRPVLHLKGFVCVVLFSSDIPEGKAEELRGKFRSEILKTLEIRRVFP